MKQPAGCGNTQRAYRTPVLERTVHALRAWSARPLL